MKNINESINCDIIACKHNANGEKCQLNYVDISACRPCSGEDVHSPADSMCASFENKQTF